MAGWNTINDRYSKLVLYIEMKPYFLIFASFQINFSMTVANTIDDRYTNFVFYIETKPHFLIFAPFESISVWQCGILSMRPKLENGLFVLYLPNIFFLDR